MKYKIGDKVTSKYIANNAVGEVTQAHYSSWSGKSNYYLKVLVGETTYSYHLMEEDLELVEAPAQDYLDLFI